MGFAMNGLTAVLMVSALIALAGAGVIGRITVRERIYNGKHAAARRP